MPDSGSPTDLMQQVRDYLAKMYQGMQTAAPQQSARSLAFEPIGMPVSPADFRLNQSDPASPLLASLGVQRSSQYSNWIPEIDADGNLNVSLRTVVGQYTIVLEESQATQSANVDGFAAVKAPAKQLFDAALTHGLDTSGSGGDIEFYPAYPTPPDWYDAASAANWQSCSFGTQSGTPPAGAAPSGAPSGGAATAPLRWRILAPVLPGAVASAPTSTPAPTTATQRVERLTMTAPIAVTATPLVTRGVISQSAGPGVVQANIALRAIDYKGLVRAANTATVQPTASDGLAMSFDYCIVQLDRPWLSYDFLTSTGWYLPGLAAGALSNGSDLSGAYKFSSIPTAFVVLKNLNITANWSDADKSAAQNAVSIGAFSLVGRQFDGATLSCPGLQILAWVCESTPALPPAADPSLAASTGPTPSTQGGPS